MIKEKLKSKPHNIHYLNRYYNFIIACQESNVNLTKRSKRNPHGIYMESHHILPKAKDLFPEYKNETWNKINLTPRQHFIAHWMLWKAYGGSQINAFWGMKASPRNNNERYFQITSKTYSILKDELSIKYSLDRSNISFTEEHKRNISLAKIGTICNEETKKKQRIRMMNNTHSRGTKRSEEWKLNRSISLTGKKRGKYKAETKPRPKTLCMYCNKFIINNMFLRYHNINCKLYS